jgi:hypothetical protein
VVSEVVVVDDAPPAVRLVVVGARKSSDEPGRMKEETASSNWTLVMRPTPPAISLQDRLTFTYTCIFRSTF